jgi:hypothetical protein
MLYQEHDDVGICRWQADFEPEDCHVVALYESKVQLLGSDKLGTGQG